MDALVGAAAGGATIFPTPSFKTTGYAQDCFLNSVCEFAKCLINSLESTAAPLNHILCLLHEGHRLCLFLFTVPEERRGAYPPQLDPHMLSQVSIGYTPNKDP